MRGSAVAFGTFLAMSCDYRVASPDGKHGANETQIGLLMPRWAVALLRYRVGNAVAERVICQSEFFRGDAALRAGFVDELQAPADVLDRAVAKCHELLKLPRGTYKAVKKRARAELIAGDYGQARM